MGFFYLFNTYKNFDLIYPMIELLGKMRLNFTHKKVIIQD